VVHPAFLYLPGRRLTLPELSAARLDGHVVEVGEGYIPADLIDGPEVRAASLASIIPTLAAACGPTAAWIHGAGDQPPMRHHVRRAVERRVRLPADRRVVVHDVWVPASDLVTIGGIAVTSAVRTMIELATGSSRDPEMGNWARLLSAVLRPQTVEMALARVRGSTRMPGSRQAEALLRTLRQERQDDVTR